MLDFDWAYPDEFHCDLCGEPNPEHGLDTVSLCEMCYRALTIRLKEATLEMLEQVAEEFHITARDVWDCSCFEVDDYEILKAEREKIMYSQNAKIKDHLERYGEITPFEALDLYGCMRLAARVADLRAAGLAIETDYETAKSGARYAVYRLAK